MFRVVLNLVKTCLEMFAEAVEEKEDCKYSCEQFGTCVKLGIHEHPTNRNKFAELFQVNASKSESTLHQKLQSREKFDESARSRSHDVTTKPRLSMKSLSTLPSRAR